MHVFAVLSVVVLAGMLLLRPQEPDSCSASPPSSALRKESRMGAARPELPDRPEATPLRAAPRPLPPPREFAKLAGMPYRPEMYHSRRVLDQDTYQVWDLDPQELDWFLANPDEMTQHDFQLVSNDGGGLRIASLREGTFASLRGLKANDLLLDINGMALERWSDIATLATDPACNPNYGFRLTFERDGETHVIDFRRSEP
jgi:hypothetical protein